VDHEDHTEPGGSDLFDGYLEPDRPHAGAFDEMFHRDGRVRSAYRALHSAIAPTAPTDLAVRAEALDRAYLDRGITFSLSGQERPIPLDIVPRVIAAAEWSKLQAGSCSGCGRWRRSSPTSTATRRSSATACCPGG
jgi:hypothetical protein